MTKHGTQHHQAKLQGCSDPMRRAPKRDPCCTVDVPVRHMFCCLVLLQQPSLYQRCPCCAADAAKAALGCLSMSMLAFRHAGPMPGTGERRPPQDLPLPPPAPHTGYPAWGRPTLQDDVVPTGRCPSEGHSSARERRSPVEAPRSDATR